MRLQQTLEKYLPLISNMLVPATLFAAGLFCFLSEGKFSFSTGLLFHYVFYALSFVGLLLLLNFNQGQPLFLMLWTTGCYIILNYLKHRFDGDFKTTIWFQNLLVITPYNLLFFYIYPWHRFISRRSLLTLLALAVEYTVIEQIGRQDISLAFYWQGGNIPAIIGFVILNSWALVNAVKDGSLYHYTVFFVAASVAAGFYYADIASGISLFFCLSQLMLVLYLSYTLIYNFYYDETTGFYGQKSYLRQSKHFPLKYSLALISIDSYDKLSATVGNKAQRIIVGMIADILQDFTPDDVIYRYAADQFIILYKKLDKKEAFAQLEEIRRKIAGLEFAYAAGKKPIKLTISCSVSEKKRSDAGAAEVLQRADKALRKTLKFSLNVTSQA